MFFKCSVYGNGTAVPASVSRIDHHRQRNFLFGNGGKYHLSLSENQISDPKSHPQKKRRAYGKFYKKGNVFFKKSIGTQNKSPPFSSFAKIYENDGYFIP
jgi:hypothetical protein